ncbi:MAG: hypothetical protein HY052_02400 [Proteobacteria bacterium]|nr:hypothetical protein [Pseudomonadota bacterium]
MNYEEHESYGKENCDDKVVVITLNKTPTAEQWESFREEAPVLGDKFKDLDYCDGALNNDGLDDDWEKTDICPRGLVGFIFKENELKIWASEAITPEYFQDVVRYTLSETAHSKCFADAEVVSIDTRGLPLLLSGNTLNALVGHIDFGKNEEVQEIFQNILLGSFSEDGITAHLTKASALDDSARTYIADKLEQQIVGEMTEGMGHKEIKELRITASSLENARKSNDLERLQSLSEQGSEDFMAISQMFSFMFENKGDKASPFVKLYAEEGGITPGAPKTNPFRKKGPGNGM